MYEATEIDVNEINESKILAIAMKNPFGRLDRHLVRINGELYTKVVAGSKHVHSLVEEWERVSYALDRVNHDEWSQMLDRHDLELAHTADTKAQALAGGAL